MTMPLSVVMILDRLTDLPVLSLPEGYDVCSLQAGNEHDWELIIGESFQKPYNFAESMAGDKQYLPERVWFVRHENRPVATATAWYLDKYGEETGCLHMVGALSAYAGKGLGKQVSVAALQRMQQEGRSKAILNTSVDRLPAIKTYLNIGFRPYIVDETHIERWKRAAETLKDSRLQQFFG